MLKEFVNRLLELAPVAIHEPLVGFKYSERELYPVRPHKPIQQNAIKLNTLTGIGDWLFSEDGKDALKSCIVHIEDHATVRVYSSPDEYYRQRHGYLVAESENDVFQFGRFMSVEDFVIKASSKFEMTPELEKLLQVVSNIRTSDVVNVEDDGITQKVTASNELKRIAQVKITPFQILRPFRTFREIEQPECRFLLRMKANGMSEGKLPEVALFEADNAKWKLDAMDSIKKFIYLDLYARAEGNDNEISGVNIIM